MSRFLVAVALLSAMSGCATSGPPRHPTSKPRSGIVEVDGAALAYLREGHGPPILIVGSATYYPKAFSRRLREHFALIFVDSRHFVPSYSPPAEVLNALTLDTFADDIEAVRQHLRVERMAVLGHSVHAQIALAYARKYPTRTTHLILLGGIPYAREEYSQERNHFWEQEASAERKAILARNLKGLEDRLAETPAPRRFAVSYLARAPLYWADPTYDAAELLRGLETGPAFERLNHLVPSRVDVRRSLESVQLPVLVVLGRLDFSIPHRVWENLIAGLNNVTYVLLERDSHSPQTEAPDRFDRELIKWFRAH